MNEHLECFIRSFYNEYIFKKIYFANQKYIGVLIGAVKYHSFECLSIFNHINNCEMIYFFRESLIDTNDKTGIKNRKFKRIWNENILNENDSLEEIKKILK